MQALRHYRSLARFVLVWFALLIGVATAAPLVSGDGLQMVCSGIGVMKIVSTSPDGSTAPATAVGGMDCPLCASVAPIPAPAVLSFAPAQTSEAPLVASIEWGAAWHSAPALPSRGPPLTA
jgi:hypothetical protein